MMYVSGVILMRQNDTNSLREGLIGPTSGQLTPSSWFNTNRFGNPFADSLFVLALFDTL